MDGLSAFNGKFPGLYIGISPEGITLKGKFQGYGLTVDFSLLRPDHFDLIVYPFIGMQLVI